MPPGPGLFRWILPALGNGTADASAESTGIAGETLIDFRSKLLLAFSLVFIFIIAYLVASQRKQVKVQRELEHLKERMKIEQ